jgi:hypothetical protein
MKYFRCLVGPCLLVLTMSTVLEAQSKTEVIVDVLTMQVSSERVDHLAVTMVTPVALLSALVADTSTEVVSQSKLRVSEGLRGQVMFAEDGSIQPGASLYSPGVTLTMTIQPQVHSTEEVTLHMEVIVHALKQYVSLGGLAQPVIVGRNDTADLRLREGEVNILGNFRVSTASGIPGLVNIPALRLTGSGNSQELMIALISHIEPTP